MKQIFLGQGIFALLAIPFLFMVWAADARADGVNKTVRICEEYNKNCQTYNISESPKNSKMSLHVQDGEETKTVFLVPTQRKKK